MDSTSRLISSWWDWPGLLWVANAVLASAIWVLIGVPVALAICATLLSWFALLAAPSMAWVAAILGGIQGLWLSLWGRGRDEARAESLVRGAVSGLILGLLGLPPMLVRMEGAIGRMKDLILFVESAAVAGVLAGYLASVLVSPPVRNERRRRAGRIGASGALLFTMVVAEYVAYGDAVAKTLPAPEVTRAAIANLQAGDAQGTRWSGCYRYWARSDSGGMSGGLQIKQTEGRLLVLAPDMTEMSGTVDRAGSFRFGGERVSGGVTIRELWGGRFLNQPFAFWIRRTLWKGSEFDDTSKEAGEMRPVACWQ